MVNDFNILEFAGLNDDKPWELKEPTPTDLRAVVLGDSPCSIEELGACVANVVGDTIEAEEIEPPGDDVSWALRVRIQDAPTDIVFWIEQLSEATKAESKVDSGWILALQTVLHPGDPLTHLSNLIRLFGSMELPVHSVCDIATGRWFPKDSIQKVFIDSDIEPPEEILWITRLVEAPEHVEPEDRWAWISTHGLNRCGRVELEMFGVPGGVSTEAVHLVDGLAPLTLETALPPEGQPISLGSQLLVSLMPCNQALNMLEEGMPGLEDHNIPTVAITAPDGAKVFPEHALLTLQQGGTSIMKTLRSTNRQSLHAQNTWDLLVSAVHQIGNSEHAACLAQVPWANTDDPDSPREYLWFTVEEATDTHVVGLLAHTPALVTTLEEGHRETILKEDLSDWIVLTPVGPLGPSESESILAFLDQFNN